MEWARGTLRQRSTQRTKYVPLSGGELYTDQSDTGDEVASSLPFPYTRTRRQVPFPLLGDDNVFYLNPRQRGLLVAFLFFLAVCVRFFRLSEPHSVVFDEVHFGGFASKYIQRLFFFDVHPPTGKLLYALAGWLAGYDGTFSFKDIHTDYIKNNVPYVAMRALPAMCGALLVPTAFLTISGMGFSVLGATLAACMVLLENSLVTQSRFILLDMPMLLFISWAVLSYTQFRNYWTRSFTRPWWTWLFLTGLNLGLAVSVKWVGLFVIAFVGLQTLSDLWTLLGENAFGRNRPIPMSEWLHHFLARLLCLVFVPVLVYFLSYYIHFAVLNVQGPGVAFMPKDFREGLKVPLSPPEKGIDVSAQISFKALGASGAPFLHSHPHLYPMEHGSGQQQVTAYGYPDHNNWFTMTKRPVPAATSGDRWLGHGDRVTLTHVATERSLYVHGYMAPVSAGAGNETLYEVSAFDGDGHVWLLELHSKAGKTNEPGQTWQGDDRLMNKGDTIRLYSELMDCYLTATEAKLPEWGFYQTEVVCSTDHERPLMLFQVDEYHKLRSVPYSELRPAVKDRSGIMYRIKDTLELQVIQWNVNQRLTATHTFQSRPESWPLVRRGISYWQDQGHRRQIYLLSNPIMSWSCLIGPPLYLLIGLLLSLRMRRQCYDLDQYHLNRFMLVGFLWTGFLLHYLPFFLMGRQLFLHHYLPAQYFMILACAAFFDLVINQTVKSRRVRLAAVAALVAVYLASFLYFSPLVYSLPMSKEQSRHHQWRKTWDFM